MGVVENLKDAADLLRKAGQIELYKQISAAEDEVRELAREKRRIEDRVEELERALRFKEETVFKAPFYYLKQGDQTPYCPHCWEKHRQAVHAIFGSENDTAAYWQCPACKQQYRIEKSGGGRQHQVLPRTGPWS
jgi:hypothetical protein